MEQSNPPASELDGRTGEGGGQLVRIAVALASATTKPIRITNVRGNRPGNRGGGLKSQHFTAIEWLAKATAADVTGLTVGSKELTFRPTRGPDALYERNITLRAASPAASALLIFQAVFPFLLFAGNESNEPIELTILGGTNVTWSFSYEYLDQVLLPTLEAWFGVRVERRLLARGWCSGSASRGEVWFRIQPVAFGSTLKVAEGLEMLGRQPADFEIQSVDISILAPSDLHAELSAALSRDLAGLLPEARLNFCQTEDSKHESRIYVLLVAKSETLRWGRDLLCSGKRKGKTAETLSSEVSSEVTKRLAAELQQGAVVDEFLQDQLVVFQALADGRTSFLREPLHRVDDDSERAQDPDDVAEALRQVQIDSDLSQDRVEGPLGDAQADSLHTTTARWVTSKILEPGIRWYHNGAICEGVRLLSGQSALDKLPR